MSIETAKAFLDALHTGDVPEAAKHLHYDVVWVQPGRTELSGDHYGKIAVLGLLARFVGQGLGIEVQEVYRCDDDALARIRITHSTGNRDEFQLITVKDNLIVRIRHSGDTDYLEAIVGVQTNGMAEMGAAG